MLGRREQRVIGHDLDILRRQVWESMCHHGMTAEFFEIVSESSDFYNDPHVVWKDAVALNVIFEEVPKVKTLKNLGWYNEDEDIRPPIIYLPIYSDWESKEVLNVKSNSLIKVRYFGMDTTADFRIMDTQLDSVYGCYWVCKLAPERMVQFEKVLEDGNYYLKKNKYLDEYGITDTELSKDECGVHEESFKEADPKVPYGEEMLERINKDYGHVGAKSSDFNSYPKKDEMFDDYSDMVMGDWNEG